MKINIGGASFRLPCFDSTYHGELLAWALNQIPDPLASVIESIKQLPPELGKLLLEDALRRKQERASLSIQSPEVVQQLTCPAGVKKHACILFKRFQPHLSEEQCVQLQEQAIGEYGEKFILNCEPENDFEKKILGKIKESEKV